MTRDEPASPSRTRAVLWGALCIAAGGAIGSVIDHALVSANQGTYCILGIMFGMTINSYLDDKSRKRPLRWTFISGVIFVYFSVLRFVFKT